MEKIVEYFENGKVNYEGEIKDNKYHGFGKKYTLNGKLIYEGEFENGLPNGKGKLFVENKIAQGTFKDGKLDGKVEILDLIEGKTEHKIYSNGIVIE